MSRVSGHIDVRDVNISFKARGAVVQAVQVVAIQALYLIPVVIPGMVRVRAT